MRLLISGAGIAGPCLAYWLLEYGFDVTLVERAAHPRRNGYLIDFWGAGFEVAERMGIAPRLREVGYAIQDLRLVNRDGKRVGGFSTRVIDRMTHGRYVSLPRGELAAVLYDRIKDRVETLFDDSIVRLSDDGSQIRAEFENAPPRNFDGVIGADGLHSAVRRVAFGDEAEFEKYLGYKVAAFESEGYPHRDESTYVAFTQVGQQVARFSLRGDCTGFLFIVADSDPHSENGASPKSALRARFGGQGWECDEILDCLDAASEVYFDRVSQIQMPHWTRGRIALVGDAAGCVSLLAGQGSALAMAGAFMLAHELKRSSSDLEGAFRRYEDHFRPIILDRQRAARRFAQTFTPRSRFRLVLRNQATRLMSLPFVAELTMGSALRDDIVLPPA
jgi:2-polyprenyl-6-methoxyphenol hydroxylase-like FAD-dependent oxidoreductase